MNRAKGKSERKAKNAVESLKQYLLHGHVIDEETKKELLRICDAVLNDEEPYSKSERGRKEGRSKLSTERV